MPKTYVPSLKYDKKAAFAYFTFREKWLATCINCHNYLGTISPLQLEVCCAKCNTSQNPYPPPAPPQICKKHKKSNYIFNK